MRAKLTDKPFRKVPFSLSHMAIFALAFAAIGGYVIWRSFAATAEIQYGTNVNGYPLMLDAYAATNPYSPIILAIHGGGWETGDKSEEDSGIPTLCSEAVIRGYACFAPNYTLSGEAKWPTQLNELQTFYSWVQSNAANYNGDPGQIASWGYSAGGHLALMLAYTRPTIRTAISYSGPTDLHNWLDRGVVMTLLGCDVSCSDEGIDGIDASPVYAAQAGSPPTFFAHSIDDSIVPSWHAESLRDKLTELDVPFQFEIGSGHGKGLFGDQKEATFTWLTQYNPPNPDAQPPTVSMTAPAGGSTLQGTIAVSATASDDAGVVGVQFKLDGSNLDAEDTTSPYSIQWDTATTINGDHDLSAVARDATGHSTTSDPVNVTISNPTPPLPPPPPPSGIPGDLDGQNGVDVIDLSILLSHYGKPGPIGDINGQNGVDVIDLSILLSHYGK